jgi:hypothetical protein
LNSEKLLELVPDCIQQACGSFDKCLSEKDDYKHCISYQGTDELWSKDIHEIIKAERGYNHV